MNWQEQVIANQTASIYENEGFVFGCCPQLYDWLTTQVKIDFDPVIKKALWKRAKQRFAREFKDAIPRMDKEQIDAEVIKYYKTELVSKYLIDRLPEKLTIISTQTNQPIKPIKIVI